MAEISISEPNGAKNFLTPMELYDCLTNRAVFYSDTEPDSATAVRGNQMVTPTERPLPFDVVCVMRERTPLPRNVI